MRVLHAYKIYRPDIEGGIPAVLSSLTQPADATTHAILCARRRGAARNYKIDGVAVEAVASLGTLFSTPIAPAYIPAFIRRARDVDVVVHHAPLPLNDAAVLLGLPDEVGLIVYWHADILGFHLLKPMMSPMIRRVLDRADRIIVSGQPMIDHSDLLRPHAAKCTVMPYGMQIDHWYQPDASERPAIDALRRAKPRHIVSLGRLVGYKGFDVLIRAMRDVDGHATIIGEGPCLQALQQLATELGVAGRVEFSGRLERDEIRRLFHASKVFAFPSVGEAEAFGIVQVEAMAAGLPIVNTALATTVPLVARHDQEALTVPPGNAGALAAALNRMLNEPQLAQRLGAGGQARARTEYDHSVFTGRMATIYAAALANRRTKSAIAE